MTTQQNNPGHLLANLENEIRSMLARGFERFTLERTHWGGVYHSDSAQLLAHGSGAVDIPFPCCAGSFKDKATALEYLAQLPDELRALIETTIPTEDAAEALGNHMARLLDDGCEYFTLEPYGIGATYAHDDWTIYAHGEYREPSVCAGDSRRVFLRTFPDADFARAVVDLLPRELRRRVEVSASARRGAR